jgi:hypothetical protein
MVWAVPARPTLSACRGARVPQTPCTVSPNCQQTTRCSAIECCRGTLGGAVWSRAARGAAPQVRPAALQHQGRRGRVRANAEASTAPVRYVLDRHGGVQAASPLMCDSSKSACAHQPYRRLRLPPLRLSCPAHNRIPRPASVSLPPPSWYSLPQPICPTRVAVFVGQALNIAVPVLLHPPARIPCIVTAPSVAAPHHPTLLPGPRLSIWSTAPPLPSYGSLKDGRLPCDAT